VSEGCFVPYPEVGDMHAVGPLPLFEFDQLAVEIRQGVLQQFPVTRILGLFELLKNSLAGQAQVFPLSCSRGSFRAQFDTRLRRFLSGLALLLFNRLTFPTTRHT